jgi:hypothetical protein
MQLNINILDHKAALFIEMLKSLDFVVSVETQDDTELLSTEEKNVLDERWAKYEKNGVEGLSMEEVLEKIKEKHGI